MDFSTHLESFAEYPPLTERVTHVLGALPEEVRDDLLTDERFSIALDNYVPGQGSTVFMATPGESGSRTVVLKPLLSECNADFAYYVIAHEFAHAFLRNGPWGEITDPEEAADSLAAHWGFVQPLETPWGRRRRFR